MRNLRQLRHDERGVALMVALATTIVLGIAVTAVIAFTSSNQRATNLSQATTQADQVAEAGIQQAYSILNYTTTAGTDPASPTLLGCARNTAANDATVSSSDCSSAAGIVVCVTAPAGCTAGSAGSATIWGCYTGTALSKCVMPGTTAPGVDVGKNSTWLLWSRGYARNANSTHVVSALAKATVLVTGKDAGYVASVWNHMFVTAPYVANQCQLDFGGNSTAITVPLYVVGNLCLPGNTAIQEVAGGQAIDLQVGGALYMGSGSSVGLSSTAPITSGVVQGGCSSVSISATKYTCAGSSPSFPYWVRTPEAFIPNDAPAQTSAEILDDFNKFDPGPNHPCATGTSPAPPTTALDNLVSGSGEPDASNPTTFDLTPTSSYACISSSGTSKGYLIWNGSGSSITVSGITVPANTLAINGSIFIDGNITLSQSATYSGSAIIEYAGTFSMTSNNLSLCATTACDWTGWQGTSGNNSMLNLASVKSTGNVFSMTGNRESFQGSIWTQPTASVNFGANSTTVQGPISVGSITSAMNNTNIKTLPVIKNMPVGAPVPPNSSTKIYPLVYT